MQDAWVVVVTSLGNYSGEAPLGALITGIVMNKARTRAARDGRVVSFSDMARSESGGPAVGPERSSPDGHLTERFSARPALTPEREAGDRQLLSRMGEALQTLPPAQRARVRLQDAAAALMEPAAAGKRHAPATRL